MNKRISFSSSEPSVIIIGDPNNNNSSKEASFSLPTVRQSIDETITQFIEAKNIFLADLAGWFFETFEEIKRLQPCETYHQYGEVWRKLAIFFAKPHSNLRKFMIFRNIGECWSVFLNDNLVANHFEQKTDLTDTCIMFCLALLNYNETTKKHQIPPFIVSAAINLYLTVFETRKQERVFIDFKQYITSYIPDGVKCVYRVDKISYDPPRQSPLRSSSPSPPPITLISNPSPSSPSISSTTPQRKTSPPLPLVLSSSSTPPPTFSTSAHLISPLVRAQFDKGPTSSSSSSSSSPSYPTISRKLKTTADPKLLEVPPQGKDAVFYRRFHKQFFKTHNITVTPQDGYHKDKQCQFVAFNGSNIKCTTTKKIDDNLNENVEITVYISTTIPLNFEFELKN